MLANETSLTLKVQKMSRFAGTSSKTVEMEIKDCIVNADMEPLCFLTGQLWQHYPEVLGSER